MQLPVDVTTLTQRQLHDLRIELINALYVNPGCEFEVDGKDGEEDRKLYRAELDAVDAQLKTFPVQI